MLKLKKIEAAHFLGSVLLLVGFFNSSFLVLRPNRIEKGYTINMNDAIIGNSLLMASFVVMICLILITFFMYYSKKIFKILQLLSLMGVLSLYFIITGRVATLSLEILGDSGRVSLGLGAWLTIIGIILILWQGVKDDASFKIVVMLCSFGVMIILYYSGLIMNISLVRELTDKSDRLLGEVVRHMQLTFAAVISGLILSMILSYYAYRHEQIENFVSGIANIAQVIPTLSLLGLLMIPLTYLSTKYPLLRDMGISGIGFFPAYIVLTLYTLLPIINNTLAGFKSIPKDMIEAAKGMGMTHRQLLWRVELPMVFPSVFIGFRIALVQTVANCTLAALVGGGGIGTILFLGLAQSASDLVIVAALTIVSIAIVFEAILSRVEKRVVSKVRGELC